VFNTLIPLSRELWPMINSVMPDVVDAQLQPWSYTTAHTMIEIGTTSATVE